MNSLDSPMDALALNYLSYGFLTAVNRMWAAWVAAVTAAFSFWRIGASPPPRPEQRGRSKDAPSTSCTPVLDRAADDADKPAKVSVSTPGETDYISASATTSYRVLEREKSTKGKFVLYYGNDDFREGGTEAVYGEDDDGVAAACEKSQRWCNMDWEKNMRIRMGDMGWYRYQDLAMFNGSVVRLWDGCSRVCATA